MNTNKPIIGIASKHFARALGGTTYKIPNPEKHDKSFDDYVHSISIDHNSKFYQIVKVLYWLEISSREFV